VSLVGGLDMNPTIDDINYTTDDSVRVKPVIEVRLPSVSYAVPERS
jgi:hypothetical protein